MKYDAVYDFDQININKHMQSIFIEKSLWNSECKPILIFISN